MYHQSFKAIKHFSMRIARSSLSKTERSDSQSHFLPNPIKGGKGGEGGGRGWRLKMEGFYLRTMRYYRPDYSWLMFLVWEITFTIFFSSSFFLFFSSLECPGFGVEDENRLKSLLFFHFSTSVGCSCSCCCVLLERFLFSTFTGTCWAFRYLSGCVFRARVYDNSIRGKWLFHSKIYSLNYW